MKYNKLVLLKLLGFVFLFWSQNNYAQSEETNSTAFKKGRWLTGLSGSMNSTTTNKGSEDYKTTSNNFGINIESGKFIKDRFLIGGRFQTNKSSTNGSIEGSTETIFIGPFSNYYFSDSKTGSLYVTTSLGYVRYKDKTQLQQLDLFAQESGEGSGVGALIGFGYSYTINTSVAFDLGINVDLFWVDIEQESLPSQTISNTNITSNDVSFSFGFNVILDDFFF